MDYEFYIVATPIGNIQDISLRAIEVLKSVDYIACEDTRITKNLCEKYGFNAILFDCHKFNEKERSVKIIDLIRQGKKVALVSDAGTPMISDPGAYLIEALRNENIKITSIPGACAVTTFLSMIPRKNEEYAFIGFLPRIKKQQQDILDKYKYTNCVFYESPNRLMETLNNITEIYGNDRLISIGRELTKVFEEVKTGKINEIIDYYNKNILKGEIVVMLHAQENIDIEEDFIKEKIEILKEEGFSPKDISKILSKLFKVNKNKVYKLIIE